VYSESVGSELSSAQTGLAGARDFYWKGMYYSAASYAVDSAKSVEYADRLISYYKTTSGQNYVDSAIAEIENRITETSNMTLSIVQVDNINDIEAIMVSIDRLRQAESLISEAKNESFSNNLEYALELTAFAEVRRRTAEEWLTLTEEFTGNENITFNTTLLRTLAQKRIEEAGISITYAYASNIDSSNIFLSQAEEYLDEADEAFLGGRYVRALFAALETRALANLAMETRGMGLSEISEKIPKAVEDALRAIVSAESHGVLPILAKSYLEYSSTFESTNPITAIIFLGYSKEFAKVSYNIINAMGGSESVAHTGGVEIREAVFENGGPTLNTYLILVCGFLLGILLSMYRIERKR
jgi:uncharacterized protein